MNDNRTANCVSSPHPELAVRTASRILNITILIVSVALSGCGIAPGSDTDVDRERAIAAAESAVEREFPHDVFELEDAKMNVEGESSDTWLVVFGFANDEGNACALVDAPNDEVQTRLVDCAFYIE